jgi:hypothetical protein
LGKALTTPQCKNWPITKWIHVPQAWSDPLVTPKQWKRNMRFCIWNIRTVYRLGSPTTVAGELARYELDLMDIQEIGWDKGATVRAGDYIFFYEKGNENHQLETSFFCTPQNSIAI